MRKSIKVQFADADFPKSRDATLHRLEILYRQLWLAERISRNWQRSAEFRNDDALLIQSLQAKIDELNDYAIAKKYIKEEIAGWQMKPAVAK